MSGLVVKHDSRSKELSNANQMMETEFVAKLKEIEAQCLDIERNIEGVKQDKAQMMQDALDPNIGQAASSAMKKEIHRMELRLAQLKRRQESMIVEMERAIHKRDAIALKYEPKAKKDKAATNTANLKRQTQSLKNNLRLCTQANSDAEQKISQRESDLSALQQSIEQSAEECGRLEQTAEQLRGEVQIRTVTKQHNLSMLLKYQRARQRYDELSMGTGPPPPGNVRALYQEQVVMKNKVV